MRYNFNGKNINIPDDEIKANMKICVSQDEAIQMWLEDNEYLDNAEQTALDTKAKAVKINHDARSSAPNKQKKPRTVKISDEKQTIFADMHKFLLENYENVAILTENKLFSVQIGDKIFKIDIIQQRKK